MLKKIPSHKIVGLNTCEATVKSLHDNRIHSHRLQHVHLVLMVYNHLRRPLGHKQFQWVRVESKNNGFSTPLFRFRYGVGNQGLMTEMDTVKIPHSDYRLHLRSTKIFDVAKNFHISRLPVWPNGMRRYRLLRANRNKRRINGAGEL